MPHGHHGRGFGHHHHHHGGFGHHHHHGGGGGGFLAGAAIGGLFGAAAASSARPTHVTRTVVVQQPVVVAAPGSGVIHVGKHPGPQGGLPICKKVILPFDNLMVNNIPVNKQEPHWTDRFAVAVNGRELSVWRTDSVSGWGQDLKLAYAPAPQPVALPQQAPGYVQPGPANPYQQQRAGPYGQAPPPAGGAYNPYAPPPGGAAYNPYAPPPAGAYPPPAVGYPAPQQAAPQYPAPGPYGAPPSAPRY